MKGTTFFLGFFLVIFASVFPAYADEGLKVDAKSYVIMDSRTGKIIAAENPHLKLPPASTTKLMTGIVAVENGNLGDIVTASENAVLAKPTKIYLRKGERVTLNDLMYALLLESANDASVAIAEKIAGSEVKFCDMMNEKAKYIGALNTNFENSNGLPSDNHYSTAYDLALIARYALTNDTLSGIARTKGKILESDRRKVIPVVNHNRFLSQFPGELAGKTGYTNAARHTFAGEAIYNGKSIVIALMGSDKLWADVKSMLDYAFETDFRGLNTAPKKKFLKSYRKAKKLKFIRKSSRKTAIQ